MRASTKANLIKLVLQTAFAQGGVENRELERRDAMAFLKDQGVQIGQIVINQGLMPADYLEKLQGVLPDVVEGEATEVS